MLPHSSGTSRNMATVAHMPVVTQDLPVVPETADMLPYAPECCQHPPSFYCPISQQCMHDPVVLADGHSYERRYIERWLEEHPTSPVSGVELQQIDLFPNHALRNAIDEYFQQVFSAHRRAIRRTLCGVQATQSLGADMPLMRAIDALMQCSLLMNAELSTGCVLRRIMDEAKQLLGAEVASVFLIDTAGRELYSNVNSTGGELRIPITAGVAGHVATTGEPVVIHDAYLDDRFNKEVDVKTGFKTRSIMCVPLKVKKGGVIGVVQLINKVRESVVASGCRADHHVRQMEETAANVEQTASTTAVPPRELSFTADDLAFLQVFASQAATAVVNSGNFHEAANPSPNQQQQQQSLSKEERGGAEERDSGSIFKDCLDLMGCCCMTVAREAQIDDDASGAVAAEQEVAMQAAASGSSDVYISKSNKEDVENFVAEMARRQQEEDEKHLGDALTSWCVDMLNLDALTGGRPLSTLGMHLFEQLGLMKHFGLPEQKLRRFLLEIEDGYSPANPYHNKAHAASVMHATYALLELGGVASTVSPAMSRDGASPECTRMEVLMACLLAAAVHDFEHVGLTNDFLVRTEHPRALLYNDQQVNENHHIAGAFAVLRRPDCNFLDHLPASQVRQIRNLVIELVLGTDMTCHDKLLQNFVEMTSSSSSGIKEEKAETGSSKRAAPSGFIPSTNKEAILLLKVTLKCADLGHLGMPWTWHVRWVQRIEEEFFQQGDQEKAAGMSVSFLMDRSKPGATKTQVGFFEYVVTPLFKAMVKAAPSTSPAYEGTQQNYNRWLRIDRGEDVIGAIPLLGSASASTAMAATAAAAATGAVGHAGAQSAPVRRLSAQDVMEATLSMSSGSAADAGSEANYLMIRRRSGRSRQRAAKWWAKVRRRTPSP